MFKAAYVGSSNGTFLTFIEIRDTVVQYWALSCVVRVSYRFIAIAHILFIVAVIAAQIR